MFSVSLIPAALAKPPAPSLLFASFFVENSVKLFRDVSRRISRAYFPRQTPGAPRSDRDVIVYRLYNYSWAGKSVLRSSPHARPTNPAAVSLFLRCARARPPARPLLYPRPRRYRTRFSRALALARTNRYNFLSSTSISSSIRVRAPRNTRPDEERIHASMLRKMRMDETAVTKAANETIFPILRTNLQRHSRFDLLPQSTAAS